MGNYRDSSWLILRLYRGLRKRAKGRPGSKIMVYFQTGLELFNDWGGGRGCNKFVPVLGGNGTEIAPPGDLFDQPSGEMS